ncbi:MAG TPA: TlpA disulfide reductase family protein [Thermoanaerobaculia bacterium]
MISFPRPLRSRRSILVAAAVASFLLLSCQESATAAGPKPGKKIDFQLKTVDGRALGPKDFPGQVVVVDFWATWCGPCHLQAEILEPIYRDFKGRGVQFLAANVGEEPETVKTFLKNKPFPYPVLLDPKDSVASNLGVYALPTLLVVDTKGNLAFFQSGIADGDTLRQVIRKAGAPPAAAASTTR